MMKLSTSEKERVVEQTKPLSTKHAAEMRKIDRLALTSKATRAQLLRGMKLHHQHNAAFRAAHGL